MSANKNVVITKVARMKLVQARAGATVLPHIVGMAFGNGGVNTDGSVINPSEKQTELANELYRNQSINIAFQQIQLADMNVLCVLMSLQGRKSAKSDYMMKMMILSVLRILPEKVRMMMLNKLMF